MGARCHYWLEADIAKPRSPPHFRDQRFKQEIFESLRSSPAASGALKSSQKSEAK